MHEDSQNNTLIRKTMKYILKSTIRNFIRKPATNLINLLGLAVSLTLVITQSSEVLVLLNKEFVKWVVIAFVIATPVAYYAMNKWLENFAYKTELSWWIFALSGGLALGIALLTVSWQSWRAATRNPVEALRYE